MWYNHKTIASFESSQPGSYRIWLESLNWWVFQKMSGFQRVFQHVKNLHQIKMENIMSKKSPEAQEVNTKTKLEDPWRGTKETDTESARNF